MERTAELESKLTVLRKALKENGLGAICLRGMDWFAWATCGGSSAVFQTTERGVAEVLVAPEEVCVLADDIDAARLAQEEVPPGLAVRHFPWARVELRTEFVASKRGRGPVASDIPAKDEVALPKQLFKSRWSLTEPELERYRALGRDAAEAATDVLLAAKPDWTGFQLAGAVADALWAKGIHPALTLIGDERRLPLYRHPSASANPLGSRAMLVVCARRHGLFANLTRFVSFRKPTEDESRLMHDVARVEAAALRRSRIGASLRSVYFAIVEAYKTLGRAGAEAEHHQGGSCGYLSRDVLAGPDSWVTLGENNAVAWNPSLPGAKIEDTAVVSSAGLEILTVDPRWPVTEVAGLTRPAILER